MFVHSCSYFDIRSVAFQDCDFLGEDCSFELFFYTEARANAVYMRVVVVNTSLTRFEQDSWME